MDPAPTRSRAKRLWLWLGVVATAVVIGALVLIFLLIGHGAKPDKRDWLDLHKDAEGNIAELTVDKDNIPPEVRTILTGPKNLDRLDRDQIKQLAVKHELFSPHEINPHLCFIEGDVTFWSKQKRAAWEMELEFLSRRLLLEAADRARVKIANQGKLSYWSGRIYSTLARMWEAQK